MPLKIHNSETPVPSSKPAGSSSQKAKKRLLVKKKPKTEITAEKPRPYLLVLATLGKSPRLESHTDLVSVAAAIRTELRKNLPEDVRVFLFKGQQLVPAVGDDSLTWNDGEQSVSIRLPLPAADAETVKVSGELFASDDFSPPDPQPSEVGLDDDFLFA